MTRSGYSELAQDAGKDTRLRECEALTHGISLLQQLQASDAAPAQCVETMLYIRRLWAFFIEDLSNPANGLPDKLRADLISIGIWIIKEADAFRQDRAGDLGQLVAINTVIRDSLR
jgi:flagellar biosynthesis activator protein FlaF